MAHRYDREEENDREFMGRRMATLAFDKELRKVEGELWRRRLGGRPILTASRTFFFHPFHNVELTGEDGWRLRDAKRGWRYMR